MQIKDATWKALDTMTDPKKMRIEADSVKALHPPAPDGPQRSAMIRCPLPFVNSSSDNTRNFYTLSIPQFRIIPRGQ